MLTDASVEKQEASVFQDSMSAESSPGKTRFTENERIDLNACIYYRKQHTSSCLPGVFLR